MRRPTLAAMPDADGMAIEVVMTVLAVVGARWLNRRLPPLSPPATPAPPPDPYELAWLRGGSVAVLQLAVYELVRAGHLVLVPASGEQAGRTALARLVRPSAVAPAAALGDPARQLLGQLAGPVDRARLHRVAPLLAGCCADADRAQRATGLLLTPGARARGWGITLLGMVVVLASAAWQLPGIQSAGEALAPAVCAAAGMLALLLLSRPDARLSPRGRSYLAACARAIPPAAGSRPGGARWTPAAEGGEEAYRPAGSAPPPGLLAVAVGGLPTLTGTVHAGLMALLDPYSVAPAPTFADEDST